MSSQIKVYHKNWQRFDTPKKRGMLLRALASASVFVAGCGIMWHMRGSLIGESGASMAMYFLGVLFIQVMNIGIFYKKLLRPESFILKMCIAAVIIAGAWVNFEEKVIMPILAHDCHGDCVIIYDRAIPFNDDVVIYREDRGWRILD